jgi:hypothetical protein
MIFNIAIACGIYGNVSFNNFNYISEIKIDPSYVSCP